MLGFQIQKCVIQSEGKTSESMLGLFEGNTFNGVKVVGKLITSGLPRYFLQGMEHCNPTIASSHLCCLEMAVRYLDGLY